jgi:predicted  nucleic acid-binding Zn-ribbon protein
MADTKPDPAHAMFGLGGESPSQPSTPAASPAPSQPGAPQYVYVPPPTAAAGGGKVLPVLVGVLLALGVVNLVLVILTRSDLKAGFTRHSDQLSVLTHRMDSSDDRYAQLRAQFDVTSEKLGMTQQELARARTLAANIQKQQKASVQQLNQAIAQKASAAEVNKLQTDANSKFGALSGDIAGTQKDLDATKAALSGAKGELTGAIARTHDELVALAHRTDRDYFEFSLPRRHSRQKIGTVMVELEKTDTKRNTFTMNLYADDKRIQRRDKALDEPVYFLVRGATTPLELVVNRLSKNSIAGYLSTPKGFFPTTPNVLAQRPGA